MDDAHNAHDQQWYIATTGLRRIPKKGLMALHIANPWDSKTKACLQLIHVTVNSQHVTLHIHADGLILDGGNHLIPQNVNYGLPDTPSAVHLKTVVDARSPLYGGVLLKDVDVPRRIIHDTAIDILPGHTLTIIVDDHDKPDGQVFLCFINFSWEETSISAT